MRFLPALWLVVLVGSVLNCDGFVVHGNGLIERKTSFAAKLSRQDDSGREPPERLDESSNNPLHIGESPQSSFRRAALLSILPAASLVALPWLSTPSAYATTELVDSTPTTTSGGSMFEPKFVQTYEDFVQTPSGMSYREVTPPTSGGDAAKLGDRVVFDWSGYTIGYFGRPFQAKGGPQGGAFDKELDYERTVLGSGKIVKGLEEALLGMKAGQVRQVIVPFGALSYPQDVDPSHEQVGPKPTTFSGQRALNFVLDNPRLDRTLLFNIKVIRVDKPNASGGFTRG